MRRGNHQFVPRKCWICDAEMKTRDQVDWFIPGDYTGCCKTHKIKEIISGSTDKEGRLKKLKINTKIPNKMRKFLINAFIFVVGFEILIHLPHIINILINKIK